jgi:predicted phage tail protein
MVKVSIEGRAGKLLGKKWKLHVGTVGEAVRAIQANVGNVFVKAFGVPKRYVVVVDGVPVSPDSYFLKKIKKSLVLIPILAGGVVSAAVWIGATIVANTAIGYAAALAIGYMVVAVAIVAFVALVYWGISSLISNMSEDPKDPKGERTSSFLFGGSENTATQGGIVPVAYGRLRVGSKAISVSNSSVDKAIWDKMRSSNSMIFR